ncbi:MAG: radical SAM protein [Caldilineaceae bacterium]|nr:radical SAM protein [Caldilineaceae bacterium]
MITQIDRTNLSRIKNRELQAQAARYLQIHDGFMEQIRRTGIEIDNHDYGDETQARLDRLRRHGALLRNDDKSVVVNHLSSACAACQTGVGSATFFVSLRCHRSCFYCFNPNQENYAYFQTHQRPVIQELDQMAASGQRLQHIALTGGEPLLYKDETVGFFAHARRQFPQSHLRLYTCGDYADKPTLARLQEAGLDEIRFSIRMHDLEKGQRFAFERIAQAKAIIPHVMVEMPIWPGMFEIMCDVLRELEALEIDSINLLELCYPLTNPQPFTARGFKVKRRPYRVLYNYWYAGGLPVARSELACLDLLEYAQDTGFKMGVHYCSLENKHTGQLYQQNRGQRVPDTHYFSQKDYLLKSAKVFGADALPVRRALQAGRFARYSHKSRPDCLEFHVDHIAALRGLDVEIGLSSSVVEERPNGHYLRELQLDLTNPVLFDRAHDV